MLLSMIVFFVLVVVGRLDGFWYIVWLVKIINVRVFLKLFDKLILFVDKMCIGCSFFFKWFIIKVLWILLLEIISLFILCLFKINCFIVLIIVFVVVMVSVCKMFFFVWLWYFFINFFVKFILNFFLLYDLGGCSFKNGCWSILLYNVLIRFFFLVVLLNVL